jgi:hypothetical protein
MSKKLLLFLANFNKTCANAKLEKYDYTRIAFEIII